MKAKTTTEAPLLDGAAEQPKPAKPTAPKATLPRYVVVRVMENQWAVCELIPCDPA
jgi:hypothetical protein